MPQAAHVEVTKASRDHEEECHHEQDSDVDIVGTKKTQQNQEDGSENKRGESLIGQTGGWAHKVSYRKSTRVQEPGFMVQEGYLKVEKGVVIWYCFLLLFFN